MTTDLQLHAGVVELKVYYFYKQFFVFFLSATAEKKIHFFNTLAQFYLAGNHVSTQRSVQLITLTVQHSGDALR